MRLKLFRAAGMSAAMAQLRAELGPDALILGTRRVAGGVEITAALEPTESAPDPGRLDALHFHAVPADLHPALQSGPLDAALADALCFAELPIATETPPLLFCGPPGAGKTLTVARLATRLVLAGAAPLIVTADGKRAGATEQLAAFTRLLGVNLIVACHPVTLGRALARRGSAAPVLIDAPGSDPFDPAQAEELATLAATAAAMLVVVMPGGIDPAEAADLAGAYASTGASAMVATRLDQTRRLGGILAAAFAGRLALTEAGIGPGAADGLVPLTPAFLAERLMQTLIAPPRAGMTPAETTAPLPQAGMAQARTTAPLPQTAMSRARTTAPVPQAGMAPARTTAPLPQTGMSSARTTAPLPQTAMSPAQTTAPQPHAMSPAQATDSPSRARLTPGQPRVAPPHTRMGPR